MISIPLQLLSFIQFKLDNNGDIDETHDLPWF